MRATEQTVLVADTFGSFNQDMLSNLLLLGSFTGVAAGASISVLSMDAVSRPCAAGLSSGSRVLVVVVLVIVVVLLVVADIVVADSDVVVLVAVVTLVVVVFVVAVMVLVVFVAVIMLILVVVLVVVVLVLVAVSVPVALTPVFVAFGPRIALDLFEEGESTCATTS